MNTKKRVTIKDVARESGCSICTVSRVINGVGVYYSEETRKKVEDAVKKLHYVPNINAKGLKESRSYNIVYLVPQMDDYYVSILNVMQEYANTKGYSILILNSNYDEKQERLHIRHIVEQHYDGVMIATGLLNQDYADRIDEIFEGIPVVLLESSAKGVKIPTVVVDVEKACSQAVEYLISLGHKRIAYVSAPCRFPTLEHRFKGYADALKKNGIELDESIIFFEQGLEKTDHKQCYDTMVKILKKHDFTAMLVISDWAAAVSTHIMNEMGKSVPEDLSVIGFDNMQFTEYWKPQISTISQNSEKLGRMGIKLLFEVMKGKEVTDIYLEGKLILRQSTGVCR